MNAATANSSSGEATTQFELLNAQDHGHLRVGFRRDSRQHFVRIVLSEFTAAASCCPILLTKDATSGDFYAAALLGFKPGECLLKNLTERGGFEPLNFQREGFFTAGEQIAIDRANARFGQKGDLLFDEARQPSPRLRQIQRVLNRLHDGVQKTDVFIRTLLSLKLVEAIDVSMNFDDGERLTLKGLYTVSMDALHALGDADIVSLFRLGDLQRIYAMNASLSQIAILADKRNRQLGGSL
jgi:hypothetical protein